MSEPPNPTTGTPRDPATGTPRSSPTGAPHSSATAAPRNAAVDEPARRRLTELEKVVGTFLRDGRLVSIPAKPRRRNLLLPVILNRCFPEDRPYEERDVNMRLALLHPDVAALRRYLVDGGLMTREAGIYRRAKPMAADSER